MKGSKHVAICLGAFFLFFCSALSEPVQLQYNPPTWNGVSNTTTPLTFSNQTFHPPPTLPGYYYEHEIASHFASKLRTCIGQVPSDHGLLIHIDDRIIESGEGSKDNEEETQLVKRHIFNKAYKFWNSIPFAQKLSVVTTAAGVITVPLYLVSAGVSFNEWQITKTKDDAIKAAKLEEEKKKKWHHFSKFLPLTPPPPPMNNVGAIHKRSMGVVNVVHLFRRATTRARKAARKASAAVKVTKEPNEALGTALTLIGATTTLLYLPSGVLGLAKMLSVRDSDTSTYKRSVLEELEGFALTCIPIRKNGEDDFVISQGVLDDVMRRQQAPITSQRLIKRGFTPDHDNSISSAPGKSKLLTQIGHGGKMLGIAYVAGLLGYSFQALSQKRDVMSQSPAETSLDFYPLDESSRDENASIGECLQPLYSNTTSADVDVEESGFQKRLHKFGKGSIFMASFLAGTLLSKVGAGVPNLPPVVTPINVNDKREEPDLDFSFNGVQACPTPLSYPSDADILSRRSPIPVNKVVIGQLHKGLNDKVAITFLASTLGFATVKSGISDYVGKTIFGSGQALSPAAGKRDVTEIPVYPNCTYQDSPIRRDPMGKYMNIGLSLAAGAMIAQHTGSLGQEKENKVAASMLADSMSQNEGTRLYTKRAVIPPSPELREEVESELTLARRGDEDEGSGGNGSGRKGGPKHERLQGESKRQYNRRIRGEFVEANKPIHFESVHHHYHVDENAPRKRPASAMDVQNGQEGAEAMKPKNKMKKSGSIGKMAMIAGAVALGTGIIHHLWTGNSNNQNTAAGQDFSQQQLLQQQAAQEQAAYWAAQQQQQAYLDGSDQGSQPQPLPANTGMAASAAKREVLEVEGAFIKREDLFSPDADEGLDKLLYKRAGTRVIETQHNIHHYGVHPAELHTEYGVPRGPAESERIVRKGSANRGSGKGGGEGRGESERQNEDHDYYLAENGDGTMKKKKMGKGKIALAVGAGAVAGMYLSGVYNQHHQAAQASQPSQPMMMVPDGYYGDSDDGYMTQRDLPSVSEVNYRVKRDLSSIVEPMPNIGGWSIASNDSATKPTNRDAVTVDIETDSLLGKRGLTSNAIFGTAAGTAIAAWIFGQRTGWRGIRKERKVPSYLLQDDMKQPDAAERDIVQEECIVKRTGALYNFFSGLHSSVTKHTPAVLKKGKVQGALVILGGVSLSTLAGLTDPPAPQYIESKMNMAAMMKRSSDSNDFTSDQSPLNGTIMSEEAITFQRRDIFRTLSTPFRPLQQLHTDIKAKHGLVAAEALIVASVAAMAGATGISKRSIETDLNLDSVDRNNDGKCLDDDDDMLIRRAKETKMSFEQRANKHIDVWALAGVTGLIGGNLIRRWWLTRHNGSQRRVLVKDEALLKRDGGRIEQSSTIMKNKKKKTVLGMPLISAASLSLMFGSFLTPLVKPTFDQLFFSSDKGLGPKNKRTVVDYFDDLDREDDVVRPSMLVNQTRWGEEVLIDWQSQDYRPLFQVQASPLMKRSIVATGSPPLNHLDYGSYISAFRGKVDDGLLEEDEESNTGKGQVTRTHIQKRSHIQYSKKHGEVNFSAKENDHNRQDAHYEGDYGYDDDGGNEDELEERFRMKRRSSVITLNQDKTGNELKVVVSHKKGEQAGTPNSKEQYQEAKNNDEEEEEEEEDGTALHRRNNSLVNFAQNKNGVKFSAASGPSGHIESTPDNDDEDNYDELRRRGREPPTIDYHHHNDDSVDFHASYNYLHAPDVQEQGEEEEGLRPERRSDTKNTLNYSEDKDGGIKLQAESYLHHTPPVDTKMTMAAHVSPDGKTIISVTPNTSSDPDYDLRRRNRYAPDR